MIKVLFRYCIGKAVQPPNCLSLSDLPPFRNNSRSTAAQLVKIWTSLDSFATPLPDI